MKHSWISFMLTIVALLVSPALFGQLDRIHTNGPEGCGFAPIYSNGKSAFIPDEYFLYRNTDGSHWEKLPWEQMSPMAMSDTLLAAFQYRFLGDGSVPVRFVISLDQGENWVERPVPPISVLKIDLQIKFVVCGLDIYIFNDEEKALYYSSDTGMTWSKLTVPFNAALSFLKAAGDQLFARWSEDDHVWTFDKSTGSWEIFLPPLGNGELTISIVQAGQRWCALTPKSIYSSEDDGATWQELPGLKQDFIGPLIWTGKYLGVSAKPYKFYYSDSFGANWFAVQSNASQTIQSTLGIGEVKQSIYLPTFFEGPVRIDLEAKSVGEGIDGLFSGPVFDLDLDGQDIWVTSSNGLFAYDPLSKIWQRKYANSELNHNSKVSCNKNEAIAFCRPGYPLVVYSVDNGVTWDSLDFSSWDFVFVDDIAWIDDNLFVSFGLNGGVKLNIQDNSLMEGEYPYFPCYFKGKWYGVTRDQQLLFSYDFGNTWTEVSGAPEHLARVYAAEDKLIGVTFDEINSTVYVSPDGENWIYANDGMPNLEYDQTYNLHYGEAWKVGQAYYFFYPLNGLYQSTDDCQTWNYLDGDRLKDMTRLGDLFYFGGSEGGVFQSGLSGQFLGKVSGKVYLDSNLNHQKDDKEPGIQGRHVGLFEHGTNYSFWGTRSKKDGSYAVVVSNNQMDTLRMVDGLKYLAKVVPDHYVIQESADTLDFGLQLIPGISDVAITASYVGALRPGFGAKLVVNYQNLGSEVSNGEVSLKLDPKFGFISAFPAPDKIIGSDSLVWTYENLQVFEERLIWITGKILSGNLGDLVSTSGQIQPENDDIDLSQNHFFIRQALVGSFDPNDKLVSPVDGLTSDEILNGKELEYTIRFQNTGTYYAERVRITDRLDTALNLLSLRLIDASHVVSEFNLLPGGLLEIVFDSIFLPDSTENELESHGFVRFAIQRNTPINPEDKIDNQARIYFDFNDPIPTNTVTTELYDPSVAIEFPEFSKHAGSLLIIYPNPANTQCTVWTKGLMSGPGQLLVSGMDGALVSVANVMDCAEPNLLSTARFVPGQYIIELKNDIGTMWGKLIVD